jgi:ribosomal protein S18 acetylase RimI-like enzyme
LGQPSVRTAWQRQRGSPGGLGTPLQGVLRTHEHLPSGYTHARTPGLARSSQAPLALAYEAGHRGSAAQAAVVNATINATSTDARRTDMRPQCTRKRPPLACPTPVAPETIHRGNLPKGAMIIRRVRPGEGAMLLALWRAAGASPSPTDTEEDIDRALRSDRLECFVAEIDSVAVGSIIAAFDGWRGNIYRLAVQPAFRRRGIARQLVEAAHDVFARWNVRRITALVENDHSWAVAFWRAVGYSHDERMARFVRNPPNRGVDQT